MTEAGHQRKVAFAAALISLVLVVAFGLVSGISESGAPLPVDLAWMNLVAAESTGGWTIPSLVLHEVGAGWPAFLIATAITGALLLWGRPWGAVFFIAAAVVSTAVVEVLKNSIARPRPTDALIEVGFGSYPSGHSARAAMIAVAVGILVPRLWVWMLGAAYTLAMMFSRTQLGAHWLTDTIAGALVGAAVAALCFVLVAPRLQVEGARGHRPVWSEG